jgi:branched-chain amino acid transport system permease protein
MAVLTFPSAVVAPAAGRRAARARLPRRPADLPRPWARIGLVVLAFLYFYLPTQQVSDADLRILSTIGIVADRRHRPQPAHRLHRPDQSGPRLLHRRRQLHRRLPRGRPGLAVPAVHACRRPDRRGARGDHRPFALRLRGHYLVIVTLGLVFLGRHIFNNWDSVTGGNRGTQVRGADMSIGPLDFSGLELFGTTYTREQSMFFLVWALVALSALWSPRTSPAAGMGRAMQAVRDRDLSAEIIGVDLARTKVGAFAWSSALASWPACSAPCRSASSGPTTSTCSCRSSTSPSSSSAVSAPSSARSSERSS